jgi:hypothetical protein
MSNPTGFVSALALALFFTPARAQSPLDLGQVKLSIQPVNAASHNVFAGGDYVFSADTGAPATFTNNNGEYTDISFAGDFSAAGKPINLACSIRMTPSVAGNFIVRIPGGNDAPRNADVTITVNNGNPGMRSFTKGGQGQVVVTNYPAATGGFLSGTFAATLGDSPNEDEVKDLYRVTGSFRVKKFD